MEYIRLDPCIDSDPDVEAAGWCAARVFELLLKVAAWKDLQGCIPTQYQSVAWLAKRWNLAPDDLPGVKPEDFIANGIARLFAAGLLSQSPDGWLIRGWDKFYKPARTNAERQQDLRDRRGPSRKPEEITVTPVTRNESNESNATPHHPHHPPTPQKQEALSAEPTDAAQQVFEHWRKAMGKNARTAFDPKRQRAVKARFLEGWTPEDLKLAVDGCLATPWNMGANDRHERYDDLELICRDSKHVEKFLAKAPAAPNEAWFCTACRTTEGYIAGDPPMCPRCSRDWQTSDAAKEANADTGRFRELFDSWLNNRKKAA